MPVLVVHFLTRLTYSSLILLLISLFPPNHPELQVEAALVRKAHMMGYLAASMNDVAVANQAGLDRIPLILEPKRYFTSFYICL